MNYILIGVATSLILLTTACFYEEFAYKEHDPENDYDYLHFWCDPKNIEKNKDTSSPIEIDPREDGTLSKSECLEQRDFIPN